MSDDPGRPQRRDLVFGQPEQSAVDGLVVATGGGGTGVADATGGVAELWHDAGTEDAGPVDAAFGGDAFVDDAGAAIDAATGGDAGPLAGP